MSKGNEPTKRMIPWLTESGLLRIQGWARDGLTNEDIAKNMGVNPKTLYDWIKKQPSFEEALRLGKEPADRKVENALFNRAVGFKEVVKKVKVLQDGTIVDYEEEVYYPPDTTAQIFWVKNRKPKEWRDKQDIDLSGEVDTGNPILESIADQLFKSKDDS